MKTSHFKKFYKALPSYDDKKKFKDRFIDETKVSYPTFYNYQSEVTPVIPYLYAEKIRQLAKELYPELAYLLDGYEHPNEDDG